MYVSNTLIRSKTYMRHITMFLWNRFAVKKSRRIIVIEKPADGDTNTIAYRQHEQRVPKMAPEAWIAYLFFVNVA